MSTDGKKDDAGKYDLRAALKAQDEKVANNAADMDSHQRVLATEYPRLAQELLQRIRAELHGQPNVTITKSDLKQRLLGGRVTTPVVEWTIQYQDRKIKFQATDQAGGYYGKFNISINNQPVTDSDKIVMILSSKEGKDTWALAMLGREGRQAQLLTDDLLRRYLGKLMLSQ